MSKQIQTISFVAFLARVLPLGIIILLIGMQAAEATQCSAAEPSNQKKHWSYRLIDGRKCWYEGENNFPKALLQWSEQGSALSAFDQADPKERLLAPLTRTVSPAEPDNQLDSESFEARWRRAVGMTPIRN
jgi:hypothetical protein